MYFDFKTAYEKAIEKTPVFTAVVVDVSKIHTLLSFIKNLEVGYDFDGLAIEIKYVHSFHQENFNIPSTHFSETNTKLINSIKNKVNQIIFNYYDLKSISERAIVRDNGSRHLKVKVDPNIGSIEIHFVTDINLFGYNFLFKINLPQIICEKNVPSTTSYDDAIISLQLEVVEKLKSRLTDSVVLKIIKNGDNRFLKNELKLALKNTIQNKVSFWKM